jgi:preprotein translocase subunit SecD
MTNEQKRELKALARKARTLGLSLDAYMGILIAIDTTIDTLTLTYDEIKSDLNAFIAEQEKK